MLAGLLNIPHNTEEWAKWSWDHRLSHDAIRAAIKKQYGFDLTDYLIDPISPNEVHQFTQNNSELHDDMNATLKLSGSNLEDADLKKQNVLAAWINLHYLEHYYAEQKLGVGS